MFKKIVLVMTIAGIIGFVPMQAGPKAGVVATAVGTAAAIAGSCVTTLALHPDAQCLLLPSLYAACCNYQGLALLASMGGACLAAGGLAHTMTSSPGFLRKVRGLLASAGAITAGVFGSGAAFSGFVHNTHNASFVNRVQDYAWAGSNGGQDGLQLMSNFSQYTACGCVGASVIATIALGLSLLIAS